MVRRARGHEASRLVRDEMGAILAQVESKAEEILGSTELTPEPPNEEQGQGLDERRKAPQQTEAELEHAKNESQPVENRLRPQALRMRRKASQVAGQDWQGSHSTPRRSGRLYAKDGRDVSPT